MKSDLYCVIGAGPSGLAAAKNLIAQGIDCEVLEKHSSLGGIWDINNPSSTCYDSTHTITSKTVTAYTDFPIAEDEAVYLHHTSVLKYLNNYAHHFDLMRHIIFDTDVVNVVQCGEYWDITIGSGETWRYKGLIIANGHNWSPKIPQYPGNFSGKEVHSAQYKNPDNLKGERVLVVGAGNTGCDIAVEASTIASKIMLSMRRGYYFVPKFIFGIPSDSLGENSQSTWTPISIIQFFYSLLLKIAVGNPEKYGLPKPDHKILESPPIVNSLIPYYVAHRRISVKSDIKSFSGNCVYFTDGTEEEVDTIIYATGYTIDFPFIDKKYLNWKNGKPDLYLMAFHPEYDNLFIAGLTDGTGGHFPTVDMQTQVIAKYVRYKETQNKVVAKINTVKKNGNLNFSKGIKFINSTRSLTQFELASFQQHMKNLIKQFPQKESLKIRAHTTERGDATVV